MEYGGTYAEQQRSFHDLVIVLILAVLLLFIVLLFEFGSFAAPIAILSSALLSTSGVFIALLITRTTFNISSFMGMIMVIGIVAKNGILLLDADQKMRLLGRVRRRRHAAGRPAAIAAHRDDCTRNSRGHAAAGVRHRRWITDAATARDRCHRRRSHFDGLVPDHHTGSLLLPERKKRRPMNSPLSPSRKIAGMCRVLQSGVTNW